MKLYYSLLEGWQVPGQQAKAALRVDLPNSPADMAAWLNARGVTMTAKPERDPVDTPDRESWAEAQGELTTAYTGPLVPAKAAVPQLGNVTPETRRQWDSEAIIDFVLDEATPAQISRILEAMGGKLGSALKAVRP